MIVLIALVSLAISIFAVIYCHRSYKNVKAVHAEVEKKTKAALAAADKLKMNKPSNIYRCEMCDQYNVEWVTGRCPDCGHIQNYTPVYIAQMHGLSMEDPRKEK